MREAGEFTCNSLPLHKIEILRHTLLNRVFALLYTCAVSALFYHHSLTLLHCTTSISFFLHLFLLLSDVVLFFKWCTTQACRINPIKRHVYLDNLSKVLNPSDYPSLDVFICTADPYKEPPMSVVNTALSVMAYDYPTEKISVYVSDDGGSDLTLFAFMEAAKFATHWLPFCREKNIMDRSPEVYFRSSHNWCSGTEKMKIMYETMKGRVESVMEIGRVTDEYITNDPDREAFDKWTVGFSSQDHPTIIQVLLESGKHKDITGHEMPNLVYVSREKRRTSPHHFKGGALNVLFRVSAAMTNAPLILTLDCDMYSNDPQTPLRVLCYFFDLKKSPQDLAFIQFPQRFHGINKNDIYGSEYKRLFQINPTGMDGLAGTTHVGTGCFFRRRVFFHGPSSTSLIDIPNLNLEHVVGKSIRSEEVHKLAQHVASCNYEAGTGWGTEIGIRYGSMVEDFYTSYRIHCQRWKSVFCNPDRPAFLGDAPNNLNDNLKQNRRWAVGLLDVSISTYSPMTYGIKSMGILMSLGYSHYAFWPILAIPITFYSFMPPIALLNQVLIFPKVSNPWFYLYAFLFLGAYVQDFLEFVYMGGTIHQWWNDQRMWSIRGISSYVFGIMDFTLKAFGSSGFGFSLTSKVAEDEQTKRYEQGIFEFGAPSPLFIPLVSTAMINLIAFIVGLARVLIQGNLEGMFVQLFLSGFVTVNCWPIYEAVALRTDKGRMPTKIIWISTFLSWATYLVASLMLNP